MTRKKYSIKITKHFIFIMPRWRFIFLAIIGIWFLSALGFWQLNRADEKRSMLMHYAQLHTSSPIALNKNVKKIENYQAIQAKGTYDNTHVFFLDNQFYQHQLGYEVIQPFILPNVKQVLLVSQGWIKASDDRHQLPVLTSIVGEQNIRGTAYFPSKSLLLLGSNSDSDERNASHWPKRIEKLDQKDMQKWLGHPIYPFIVRLNAISQEQKSLQHQANDSFIRDWPIVALPPERHIGYAVQWFAMAAVGLILLFAVNIKKLDNKKGDKK